MLGATKGRNLAVQRAGGRISKDRSDVMIILPFAGGGGIQRERSDLMVTLPFEGRKWLGNSERKTPDRERELERRLFSDVLNRRSELMSDFDHLCKP
mmetsp:Transcript_15226/g.31303  ORF Transcript_15226/g.31303 Transcript_15226/m.31303 type:complete len:97 (-) Transcript_15226:410-700(-)